MSSYHPFTTARLTEPDLHALTLQLRALDPTAGVQHTTGAPTYTIKKATPWTGPQIAAVQTILDTAAAATPQLTAQALVDTLSLVDQAVILAIIDQINVLRAALPVPLPPITRAQAIAAIRAKAATL